MLILTKADNPDIDWNQLALLIERAGLGQRNAADVAQCYRHSTFCWWGYHQGKLIASAHAISDLTWSSYLADVVVDPQYQGRGYGHQLITNITQTLLPYGKIFIYAVPDKLEFYKRYNFQILSSGMVCATDEKLARMRQNGYIQ